MKLTSADNGFVRVGHKNKDAKLLLQKSEKKLANLDEKKDGVVAQKQKAPEQAPTKDVSQASDSDRVQISDVARRMKSTPLTPNKVKSIVNIYDDMSISSEEKIDSRPKIYFIKGMDLLSSSSSGGIYDGIRLMSESRKDSQLFAWNEKDKIIDEIKRSAPDVPIVLVGHSLGGDTALEVAKELNTLKNGFRKVSLLVTIDSVGMDNDIIPQNVKKNLNFIGQGNTLLNDSPHIAKNSEKTEVVNILRNEGHTELDDSVEIQAEIMQAIQNEIFDYKLQLI